MARAEAMRDRALELAEERAALVRCGELEATPLYCSLSLLFSIFSTLFITFDVFFAFLLCIPLPHSMTESEMTSALSEEFTATALSPFAFHHVLRRMNKLITDTSDTPDMLLHGNGFGGLCD